MLPPSNIPKFFPLHERTNIWIKKIPDFPAGREVKKNYFKKNGPIPSPIFVHAFW